MLILDLWGISFHPAVVAGLGNDLLFNSILGHCVTILFYYLTNMKSDTYFKIRTKILHCNTLDWIRKMEEAIEWLFFIWCLFLYKHELYQSWHISWFLFRITAFLVIWIFQKHFSTMDEFIHWKKVKLKEEWKIC